jgi:hypothetical protein
MTLTIEPWKGPFPSLRTHYPALPLYNLFGDCLLAWTFSPYSLSEWPTPSTFLPQTLHYPSTSWHSHFSFEDGCIVFLQNVDIYLQMCMVPKPRTSSSNIIFIKMDRTLT